MKCVYLHKRTSDGEVFYIGIGNLKRPFNKTDRNPYWKNYVAKHGDFEVQIIEPETTSERAKMLERGLICIFKRAKDGGTLVNITKGGDSNPMENPEAVEAVRLKLKGRKFSQETLMKMSKAKKGIPIPDYLRIAISGPKPGSHMKLPDYREMTRKRFKGKARGESHKAKNGIVHSKSVSAHKDGNLVKVFASQREAAKWAGCTAAMIGMNVSGKCKTAKGYEFKRHRAV